MTFLGSSQAVRQGPLKPPCEGSIPSSPATVVRERRGQPPYWSRKTWPAYVLFGYDYFQTLCIISTYYKVKKIQPGFIKAPRQILRKDLKNTIKEKWYQPNHTSHSSLFITKPISTKNQLSIEKCLWKIAGLFGNRSWNEFIGVSSKSTLS